MGGLGIGLSGVMVTPDVPDQRSGEWSVSHVTIDKHMAAMENMRYIRDGTPELCVFPGTYKRLIRGGTLVMSNTPMELKSNHEPVHRARGNVLINGLGLGIVAHSCSLKPEVQRVVVVEKSLDVINMVLPHLRLDKVSIVHDDCFEWKAPKDIRWDVVWHDIWDDIAQDNLKEMATLHRRYGRKCEWQGSWMKEFLERERKRERRSWW